MMFLKKGLSCVLMLSLLLALLSLTACHGSKKMDPFVMPDAFDTSREYEITFWAKSDTNVTQTNIYKKAIADFEEKYPNISVKLNIYTDYGRIYNDVITNISTGTTPNVCITYPDHIATYLMGDNTVVPLDELMVDPEYGLGGSEVRFDAPTADEIVPKYLGECLINGEQYALPYMRSTEACYVNKTFVEKLGYTLPETLTWDFVWEVSEAAMAQDEEGTFLLNGQKTLIPFIYKSTDNMMIQMLRQKGAGYSSDDGEVLIFNDTTTELLSEVAVHAGTRAFSTFKISSYPANFLNRGQCIFAIDSTAGATWMGCDAPLSDIDEDMIVRFETAVMEVPQFDPGQPTMISQGPSMCIFNKEDPQEVMASWLFMQYLLTNDVQISYAQTEGYAPVTLKAQQSAEYLDYLSRGGEDNDFYYDVKLKATKLLLDNVENTFTTPVFAGSASLRDAAGQMIENVTKSMRRGQTVDDAYFGTMYDDVRALYRLNSAGSLVTEKAELGAMPTASVVLISTLVGAWVLIGVYFLVGMIKKSKKSSDRY